MRLRQTVERLAEDFVARLLAAARDVPLDELAALSMPTKTDRAPTSRRPTAPVSASVEPEIRATRPRTARVSSEPVPEAGAQKPAKARRSKHGGAKTTTAPLRPREPSPRAVRAIRNQLLRELREGSALTSEELRTRVGGPAPAVLEAALGELLGEGKLEVEEHADGARFILARVARRQRAKTRRRRPAEEGGPTQVEVNGAREESASGPKAKDEDGAREAEWSAPAEEPRASTGPSSNGTNTDVGRVQDSLLGAMRAGESYIRDELRDALSRADRPQLDAALSGLIAEGVVERHGEEPDAVYIARSTRGVRRSSRTGQRRSS